MATSVAFDVEAVGGIVPKTFGQHPKHEGPGFGGGVKVSWP